MSGPSITVSDAPRIASYSYSPGTDPNTESEVDIAQALHRIRIINAWVALSEGTRVLEIGCGQGNCTIVLAEAVGSSGKVDAIDPAPQDYGAPVTLGEAQSWISQSPIGSRVAWHEAAPEEFLKKAADEGLTWDVAVLSHCIWYFKSPKTLENILRALQGRVKTVCIAEYALQATNPAAAAHLLAVDLHVKDERLAANIKASREAVIATAALNGGLKGVQTMDVWVGTFV